MTWVLTVVGAAIVLAALWDVFHTLWHPSGQGPVCKAIMAGVWRLTRHLGERAGRLGGPAAMLAVIGAWALLLIIGWALVYGPHVPEGFLYSSGLQPGERSGVLDALYVSTVTLATLGFGDIVPTVPGLRLAVPLQALLGFGLLTAAVSWVLQVYPALTRRRVFSLRLATMRRAETVEVLGSMGPTAAAELLRAVADGVAQARMDLTQYSETYYFRDAGAETALALTVEYAQDLAREGQRASVTEVRQAATTLSCALQDLAQVLDGEFFHTGGDTADVLAAYARDQRIRHA